MESAQKKKSKKMLDASEELFCRIFDHSSDAVFIIDTSQDLILDVNPKACLMLGYSREELLSLRPSDICSSDMSKFLEFTHSVSENGQGCTNELSCLTGSGQLLPVEISASIIDISGRRCMIALVRDISDSTGMGHVPLKEHEGLKQTLEKQTYEILKSNKILKKQVAKLKLAESERKKVQHNLEERLKELTVLHHTVKILVHEKKTISDVLQELVLLLPLSWQYPEITAARIKYDDVEFKTTNFAQTKWRQAAEFTTADGKHGLIEIVYLEDKPVDFEGPFLKEERNLINSLSEILRSFIDRKDAERVLWESEERYRQLVEHSPEGIYVHSGGKIVFVNRAGAKLLGAASSEELIGKPVLSFIHPDYVEIVKERIRQIQEEGKPAEANVELKYIRLDGEVIDVKVAGTPIIYQGKPAVQIATSDITELKRSEEALKKALLEVEQLKNRLRAENIYLQEEIKTEYNYEEIVGQNESILKLLHNIEMVAPTGATVLIMGETGTGKELIARAIHNLSSRKDRPLVKVNCTAISAGLVESELFGHEKGAFTGAIQQRVGRFELADGGTIFLDEVGEVPLDTQVKLLRVLQEGEFERVGSNKSIKVDVRIIAATNRDLLGAVKEGSFRSDLFYRLNVFPIEAPPLRERKSDIPLLANFFLNKFAKKLSKKIDRISEDTMDLLMEYSWPGNIRELQNVIERAVVLAQDPVLRIDESMIPRLDSRPKTGPLQSDSKRLEDIERSHILSVLEETNWTIEGNQGAALVLGLNPSTLRSRMQKLGIKKPRHTS